MDGWRQTIETASLSDVLAIRINISSSEKRKCGATRVNYTEENIRGSLREEEDDCVLHYHQRSSLQLQTTTTDDRGKEENNTSLTICARKCRLFFLMHTNFYRDAFIHLQPLLRASPKCKIIITKSEVFVIFFFPLLWDHHQHSQCSGQNDKQRSRIKNS